MTQTIERPTYRPYPVIPPTMPQPLRQREFPKQKIITAMPCRGNIFCSSYDWADNLVKTLFVHMGGEIVRHTKINGSGSTWKTVFYIDMEGVKVPVHWIITHYRPTTTERGFAGEHAFVKQSDVVDPDFLALIKAKHGEVALF